jgi:hypothetical protein
MSRHRLSTGTDPVEEASVGQQDAAVDQGADQDRQGYRFTKGVSAWGTFWCRPLGHSWHSRPEQGEGLERPILHGLAQDGGGAGLRRGSASIRIGFGGDSNDGHLGRRGTVSQLLEKRATIQFRPGQVSNHQVR